MKLQQIFLRNALYLYIFHTNIWAGRGGKTHTSCQNGFPKLHKNYLVLYTQDYAIQSHTLEKQFGEMEIQFFEYPCMEPVAPTFY